jgi:hypothetical protein
MSGTLYSQHVSLADYQKTNWISIQTFCKGVLCDLAIAVHLRNGHRLDKPDLVKVDVIQQGKVGAKPYRIQTKVQSSIIFRLRNLRIVLLPTASWGHKQIEIDFPALER